MLSEILKLLKERGPMSLAELARHFQAEISAMEGMLETLEAKGRIVRLDTKCSKCKGCVEVKPEDAAIFQWKNEWAEAQPPSNAWKRITLSEWNSRRSE